MATKKKRKSSGSTLIGNSSTPFHIRVNGKEMYSLFTGSKNMTWEDAEQNRIAWLTQDPSARVQMTRTPSNLTPAQIRRMNSLG